ncbi:family 1 putative carbohydrate esterase [Ascodesmis nigricans]|uniref:S-formylglutathione hydrolase n=1 Tax=Ascodesmis nigricans TaxID=341454 RepID=A0A4V3SJF9_9PEZI|nr:family 1 putative carbohydrate esterase [Ascodesmis nigricans]
MPNFETRASIASFGGKLLKLTHHSKTTQTPMNLNLFLPASAFTHPSRKLPLLIYLSGLTCTADNCSEKGFFQHGASLHNLAILYPDTSPRGLNLPNESDSWDFGSGAGFYVDAETDGYRDHYRMESYITTELPELLWGEGGDYRELIDGGRVSITGHSMGGHGALTLYLRHPELYRSVSAFAPIANPLNCPWGQKAFKGYLGEDQGKWREHDATELVRRWGEGKKGELRMLVDVGTSDSFASQGQLLVENLEKAVVGSGLKAGKEGVEVRYQKDYDHSYYFMASFADEHVEYHAKFLKE